MSQHCNHLEISSLLMALRDVTKIGPLALQPVDQAKNEEVETGRLRVD